MYYVLLVIRYLTISASGDTTVWTGVGLLQHVRQKLLHLPLSASSSSSKSMVCDRSRSKSQNWTAKMLQKIWSCDSVCAYNLSLQLNANDSSHCIFSMSLKGLQQLKHVQYTGHRCLQLPASLSAEKDLNNFANRYLRYQTANPANSAQLPKVTKYDQGVLACFSTSD